VVLLALWGVSGVRGSGVGQVGGEALSLVSLDRLDREDDAYMAATCRLRNMAQAALQVTKQVDSLALAAAVAGL
jgi:hypothetical protein